MAVRSPSATRRPLSDMLKRNPNPRSTPQPMPNNVVKYHERPSTRKYWALPRTIESPVAVQTVRSVLQSRSDAPNAVRTPRLVTLNQYKRAKHALAATAHPLRIPKNKNSRPKRAPVDSNRLLVTCTEEYLDLYGSEISHSGRNSSRSTQSRTRDARSLPLRAGSTEIDPIRSLPSM
jgi:hypothetical protein